MKFKNIALTLIILFSFAPFHVSNAQFTTPGCYINNGVLSRVGDTDASGGCPSGGNPIGPGGVLGATVPNNIPYTPLEPLPGQATDGNSPNFCNLLNLLFKVLIYLGGMLAVLFLVLGGISYMISEVVDKRTLARERIKGAIYGLLLLLVSWIILYTINPQLVNACNIVQPTLTGVYYAPPSVVDTVGIKDGAIVAPDGNAALNRATATDPTSQQAATNEYNQLVAYCAQLGGVVLPGDAPQSSAGCATDISTHIIQNGGTTQTFEHCLNVQTTVRGTFKSCYY